MFFVRLRSFHSFPNPSFLRYFHSHSHSLNPHDAVSFFNRLLRMHPTPSIIQFNKIFTSLVKTKHYTTAISLSRQMEFTGIMPDIFTSNILINCHCHLGQITCAFSVLSRILKRGFHPDTFTFNTLIKGLCLHGKLHRALQFHDHVLAQGFRLDQVSYGTLINGLCKMGETRAALELLRRIEGRGMLAIRPDVCMYNIIIDSLCIDKLVSDAFDLYSEMVVKRIHPDVFTYNALIYGFCIVGQLKEAIGLLEEMVLKNIYPNDYTFNILVDALCKEGKVREAKNVLAVMMKQGVKPDVVTYSSLMDGYFLVNEVSKAQDVFNAMGRRGETLDAHSYTVMINGLCKIKMVDEALNLLAEMDCKKIIALNLLAEMSSCSLCPLCQSSTEDYIHIFRDCSEIRPFWESVLAGRNAPSFFSVNWGTWFATNISGQFSGRRGVEWPHFFAAALSSIWRMRNEFVFQQHPCSTARIWSFLKSLGLEQQNASSSMPLSLSHLQGQHRGVFDNSQTRLRNVIWTPPDANWLKINVDGAVSATLQASCGGVIRDSVGAWIKGYSWNLGSQSSANVFLAELLAVKTAVEAAMSLDLNQVIVETDSMEVVEWLASGDITSHHYEVVARTILDLQSEHGSLVIQHAPREGNCLADYLAKVGLSLHFGEHWFDHPFGECHSILYKDQPVGPV